jgi:bacterioferritin-associated ferredoxin
VIKRAEKAEKTERAERTDTLSVLVNRCLCRNLLFSELLPRARAAGWSLLDLMSETGCGAQCGLCRPYLRRMLRTGETAFSELLSPEDG